MSCDPINNPCDECRPLCHRIRRVGVVPEIATQSPPGTGPLILEAVPRGDGKHISRGNRDDFVNQIWGVLGDHFWKGTGLMMMNIKLSIAPIVSRRTAAPIWVLADVPVEDSEANEIDASKVAEALADLNNLPGNPDCDWVCRRATGSHSSPERLRWFVDNIELIEGEMTWDYAIVFHHSEKDESRKIEHKMESRRL
ncbi:hypothetical protein BDW62DRAFT_197267 [Aspergillus aurantiobrunneus]